MALQCLDPTLPCSSFSPAPAQGQLCWLKHLQLIFVFHTVFAPSAWEKPCICRTLL